MTRLEAIEIVKSNWPDSKYTMLIEAIELLIADAQAKTMEELLICYKASIVYPKRYGDSIEWYRNNKDRSGAFVDEDYFADAVAMFLAAGGVIKE